MLKSLGLNKKICFTFLLCLSLISPGLAQENNNSRKRRVTESFFLSEKNSYTERQLLADQTHKYQLYLKQDQYLNLAVIKKDTDLVVKVFDPNEKKLLEITSSDRPQDPELGIYLLMEITGSYRLEISIKDPTHAGSYGVKIKELRIATQTDKQRIASQALYDEAEQLRSQNTNESLEKAFAIYNKILPVWQQINDQEGEAATLNAIGSVYYTNKQYAESLQYLERSLKIWQSLNNPLWEVATLNSLGTVSSAVQDNRRALYFYLKAQQVATKLNDPQWQAFTLNGLGKVSSDLEEFDQALIYYQQARLLKRSFGDKRGEAITLTHLGNIYNLKQDYSSSIDYNNEALAIFKSIGDSNGEASTLNNLGRSYMLLKNYNEALNQFQQALKKKQELADLRGEAMTFNNIGYLYMIQSQEQNFQNFIYTTYYNYILKQNALDTFKQALAIWQKLDEVEEQLTSLSLIAKTFSALGDEKNADKSLSQINSLNTNSRKALEFTNYDRKASVPSIDKTSLQASNISNNQTNTIILPKVDSEELPIVSKASKPSKKIIETPTKINLSDVTSERPLNSALTKTNQSNLELESKNIKAVNDEIKTVSQGKGKYTIQVSSLSNRVEAEAMCNRLRSSGLTWYVAEGVVAGKSVFRIRTGQFQNPDEAKKVATQLKEKGAISQYFITSQ
ncbi:MAG: tetratricopeptide repeat protein [Acidobacteria bacterium]|nr:tetratricopeptide repeat protein [Acidobacteriota bacterium]